MQYSARLYVEKAGNSDAVNELLFSRASAFRMTEAHRRHLSVQVARLDIPSASVLRVSSSGHEIDLVDDEVTTIMLPLSGRVLVSAGENRFQSGPAGSLTFLPSARRTTVEPVTGGSFEALMLKMPMSGAPADEDDRRLALTAYAARTPLVQTSVSAMASLRELLDYATTDLASREPVLSKPHTARCLEVLIQEQFRALFPESGEGGRITPVSATKIYAAEEFMRANYAEPIGVADIAGACGVGVRSLQLTFRAVTGVSPWTRLSEIRLEQAYLHLISGTEMTVTQVALACGVAHLGRFAQAYRRRYGELPSATHRRGLGRPTN